MTRTLSTMLPLGTRLPKFELPVVQIEGFSHAIASSGVEGLVVSSEKLPLKPLLIMVICAHCPFVKHIENELSKLDQDFGDQIRLIAIASNSLITHPQDWPVYLAKQAKDFYEIEAKDLGKMEYVKGNEWIAGNISYHLPERPKWIYSSKDLYMCNIDMECIKYKWNFN